MNRQFCWSLVGVLCAAAALTGCTSGKAKPAQTGFLSDYSMLQPEGQSTLRFIDRSALARYNAFIIDPVTVYFHGDAKGTDVPYDKRDELTIYMRGAIVEALADGYDIVSTPGPGVARVRIAVTDIKSSTQALNVLPTTRITGMGLGGASVEAEIVDSRTGEQLAGLVESRLAQRLNMAAGWSKFGDAKAVMQDWARNFRRRLDEVHGR